MDENAGPERVIGKAVTINYTADDAVHANQLCCRLRPQVYLTIAVVAGLVVLASWLWFPDEIIGIAAAVIGGAIALAGQRWLLVPFQARRQFRNYPLLQQPVTLGMTEAGLQLASPQYDGLLRWSDITGWRTNELMTIVHPAPKMFYMLPARMAQEGFPLAELQERLRQEVGPAR